VTAKAGTGNQFRKNGEIEACPTGVRSDPE
jgi:hypothetical protein